jgi:hypothetical protein
MWGPPLMFVPSCSPIYLPPCCNLIVYVHKRKAYRFGWVVAAIVRCYLCMIVLINKCMVYLDDDTQQNSCNTMSYLENTKHIKTPLSVLFRDMYANQGKCWSSFSDPQILDEISAFSMEGTQRAILCGSQCVSAFVRLVPWSESGDQILHLNILWLFNLAMESMISMENHLSQFTFLKR